MIYLIVLVVLMILLILFLFCKKTSSKQIEKWNKGYYCQHCGLDVPSHFKPPPGGEPDQILVHGIVERLSVANNSIITDEHDLHVYIKLDTPIDQTKCNDLCSQVNPINNFLPKIGPDLSNFGIDSYGSAFHRCCDSTGAYVPYSPDDDQKDVCNNMQCSPLKSIYCELMVIDSFNQMTSIYDVISFGNNQIEYLGWEAAHSIFDYTEMHDAYYGPNGKNVDLYKDMTSYQFLLEAEWPFWGDDCVSDSDKNITFCSDNSITLKDFTDCACRVYERCGHEASVNCSPHDMRDLTFSALNYVLGSKWYSADFSAAIGCFTDGGDYQDWSNVISRSRENRFHFSTDISFGFKPKKLDQKIIDRFNYIQNLHYDLSKWTVSNAYGGIFHNIDLNTENSWNLPTFFEYQTLRNKILLNRLQQNQPISALKGHRIYMQGRYITDGKHYDCSARELHPPDSFAFAFITGYHYSDKNIPGASKIKIINEPFHFYEIRDMIRNHNDSTSWWLSNAGAGKQVNWRVSGFTNSTFHPSMRCSGLDKPRTTVWEFPFPGHFYLYLDKNAMAKQNGCDIPPTHVKLIVKRTFISLRANKAIISNVFSEDHPENHRLGRYPGLDIGAIYRYRDLLKIKEIPKAVNETDFNDYTKTFMISIQDLQNNIGGGIINYNKFGFPVFRMEFVMDKPNEFGGIFTLDYTFTAELIAENKPCIPYLKLAPKMDIVKAVDEDDNDKNSRKNPMKGIKKLFKKVSDLYARMSPKELVLIDIDNHYKFKPNKEWVDHSPRISKKFTRLISILQKRKTPHQDMISKLQQAKNIKVTQKDYKDWLQNIKKNRALQISDLSKD